MPYVIEERLDTNPGDIWKDNFQNLSQSSDIDFVRFYREHVNEYPVPSGWWFDGNSYLDVHGNRREVHPHIEAIVDAFCLLKNSQINRFNRMLTEVEEWLL